MHTLMETVSALLGLVASAIAFTRYYTKKTTTYLFLGSGFLGATFLEGYHAAITSSFLVGHTPSALVPLTAWSGVTPRVFLSVLMLLSSLATEDGRLRRLLGRIGELGVHIVVATSTIAWFLVFTSVRLPPALYPHALLNRPVDLIPSLFFGLAALVYLQRGGWKTSQSEHWLILSLIAAASGHLFYLVVSPELYDAPYFAAHLLKILSFVLVLIGLFSSVFSVFRSEAESVVTLHQVNEALADEVEERERAEQGMRRSRDELDVRVQERTADLAERSWELRAAHDEMALFLASIPSILIGLDGEGRITLWNSTASEIFDIPVPQAIGRSLGNCGIQWLLAETPGKILDWLQSEELVRCDDLAYEKDGDARLLGLTIRPIRSSGSERRVGFLVTGADITDRRAMEGGLSRLAAIVESSDAAIISVSLAGYVLSWNPAAERIYGYRKDEVKDRHVSVIWPPEAVDDLMEILRRLRDGGVQRREGPRLTKGGQRIFVAATYSPLYDASGETIAAFSITNDITERKELERQLAQAQKLESIGQLAAGIAHEINTPIQYVGDNIRFLRDSFARLEQLLAGYDRLLESVRSQSPDAPFLADIEALAKAVRVSYLRAEIPKSIEDSLEGAGRVAEIVRAIKEFSHPGPAEKTPLDISRAIESTVLVSRNEWKYVADLNTELDADLPPVMCVPGEFNQVILNLIVNAAHAIADVVSGQPGTKGTITVSTARDGDWAEIRVSDTGTGIPDQVQSSVFNPFFTTKGVGKGTGQGLAIAHTVIVQKHGGTICFDTAMGIGTTFRVRLPIDGETSAAGSGPLSQLEVALADAQPSLGATLQEGET